MTSIVDFKGGNAIEAEARAWVVQLDGRTPSSADLAALREWASRSPKHAAALADMAALWGDLGCLALARDAIDQAAQQNAQPRGQKRAGRPGWRGAVVAGMLAVVAIAAVAFGPGLLQAITNSNPPRVIYATAVGQQNRIALPDGSSVQLNTNSVLEVAFLSRERRIRLVRGEAYFDVAHEAGRPFVVFADNSAVRAVGTEFAVRVETEQVDVTVVEGAVELFSDLTVMATPDEPPFALLAARQTASVSPGSSSIRSLPEQELERALSWRTGVLAFEGDPLEDVIAEVSRYTDELIVVDDPELLRLRIGGRFGIGETDALLEALESAFGVAANRDPDGVVRLQKVAER